MSENVGRATAAIVAVALGGLLAGLVLAVAIARSLARPLSGLAASARRLGAGELSTRAGKLEGGAEVDELAGSFDEMAGRVERTVRAQREFVANASHQLRTPLTGIKLRLEAAIAETPDDAVRDQLRPQTRKSTAWRRSSNGCSRWRARSRRARCRMPTWATPWDGRCSDGASERRRHRRRCSPTERATARPSRPSPIPTTSTRSSTC